MNVLDGHLRLNHNNLWSFLIDFLGHHVAKGVVFLAMDVLNLSRPEMI